MKLLESVSDDVLSRTLSAHALTNTFYKNCGFWLEKIEAATLCMGGDSEDICLIRNLASLACAMRANCQPPSSGKLRIRQEEQVWGQYRDHARQLNSEYLSSTVTLKATPLETDYDSTLDGESSPWQETHDSKAELYGRPFWSDLMPLERTQFRMQMGAIVIWHDLDTTVKQFPRLLRRILRRIYYFDVANNKTFTGPYMQLAQSNPDRWQWCQYGYDEVYALYKAALNARRHVAINIQPYIDAEGRIQVLPAAIAGKKAWAEYWALTVPSMPLLLSFKISKSCSVQDKTNRG